jgi:hypothetical protein
MLASFNNTHEKKEIKVYDLDVFATDKSSTFTVCLKVEFVYFTLRQQ